jgi:SAM-dependent methyltransferase
MVQFAQIQLPMIFIETGGPHPALSRTLREAGLGNHMVTSDDEPKSLITSEREYAAIKESRIAVVFPRVKQLIRQHQAEAVLDFGGGDGLFLDKYLPSCVTTAVHYDASTVMQNLATNRLAKSHCKIVRSPKSLESRSFDVITLIAVWMEFPSDRAAMKNLNLISRLLKQSGHLIAAVTHPCFREEKHCTFWTDFSNSQYLNVGHPYKVSVTDGQQNASFQDYHWNLEQMSSQLARAGFSIRRMYETTDVKSHSNPRGAPWLIIDAEMRAPTCNGAGSPTA